MNLENQLYDLIETMPEIAHKLQLMRLANKIIAYLKLPDFTQDNAKLSQFIADFVWQYVSAIGFAAAMDASKNDANPLVKSASVLASITAILPFIFNVVTKIKRTGAHNISPLFNHVLAQTASTFTFLATFYQGSSMLICQNFETGEQIKNCMLVALATTFTVQPSYAITRGFLDRICQSILPHNRCAAIQSEEDLSKMEDVKQIILDNASQENLFLTILIFIFCVFSFNQGAIDFREENKLGNLYAFNVVLLPIVHTFASLIFWIYRKIVDRR